MVLTTVLMYLVNQDRNGLNRCVLRNAMAKVEHMTTRTHHTKIIKHPASLLAYCLLWRKQSHGIKVALQSNLVTGTLSGLTKVHRPVQPQGIATRGNDFLKPHAAPLGKEDDG